MQYTCEFANSCEELDAPQLLRWTARLCRRIAYEDVVNERVSDLNFG